MTITDIVILVLSIYFAASGFSKGFLRSLLGPISIIIATIVAIFYYQITKDFVVSLLIGLFGPILLHLVLKLLLKTWSQATDLVKPDALSRLCGALLTLAWGWIFIALVLILLAIFPPWGKTLTAVHSDVMRSTSYGYVKPWVKNFLPAPQENNSSATGLATAKSDAQSLAQDPRFLKVMEDPEIQAEINNHDIAKLMSNPKMIALTQQVMTDPAMLKKIMSVYHNQSQLQTH